MPVCKLQVCNLVFNKFVQAEQQKVNKHSKFKANFGIQRQLEHFEYDMNYTLVANYGQDNCSIPLENVDVHGIMLSSQTSIDYIMSCFESRQRYNKEPWILFIKVL